MAKKKELWITHGTVNHSHADRHDCLDCINVEIEYLQELKRVGGITKLLKEIQAC